MGSGADPWDGILRDARPNPSSLWDKRGGFAALLPSCEQFILHWGGRECGSEEGPSCNPFYPGDPIPARLCRCRRCLRASLLYLQAADGDLPVGEEGEEPSSSFGRSRDHMDHVDHQELLLLAETEGSCSAPACPQRGAPNFQQEKQKRWETSRAPAQGVSLHGSGPSLSLAGLCHRGDTSDK